MREYSPKNSPIREKRIPNNAHNKPLPRGFMLGRCLGARDSTQDVGVMSEDLVTVPRGRSKSGRIWRDPGFRYVSFCSRQIYTGVVALSLLYIYIFVMRRRRKRKRIGSLS